MKDKSKLTKKTITNKRGKRQTVWVKDDKHVNKVRGKGWVKPKQGLENDVRDLHELSEKLKNVAYKRDGVITDEYRNASAEWAKEAKAFKDKHGEVKLRAFVVYKTLKKRLESVVEGKCNLGTKVKRCKGEHKYGL